MTELSTKNKCAILNNEANLGTEKKKLGKKTLLTEHKIVETLKKLNYYRATTSCLKTLGPDTSDFRIFGFRTGGILA